MASNILGGESIVSHDMRDRVLDENTRGSSSVDLVSHSHD